MSECTSTTSLTLRTLQSAWSAQFDHTILITETGYEILTGPCIDYAAMMKAQALCVGGRSHACSATVELCGGIWIFLGLSAVIAVTVDVSQNWSDVFGTETDVGERDFEVAQVRSFRLPSLGASCHFEVYTQVSDCSMAGLQEISSGGSLLECASCQSASQLCQRHAVWEDLHKPPLRLVAYILDGGHDRAFNVTAEGGAWVINSCRTQSRASWFAHALILISGVTLTACGSLLCFLTRTS
eukprot:s6752_g2.t1